MLQAAQKTASTSGWIDPRRESNCSRPRTSSLTVRRSWSLAPVSIYGSAQDDKTGQSRLKNSKVPYGCLCDFMRSHPYLSSIVKICISDFTQPVHTFVHLCTI